MTVKQQSIERRDLWFTRLYYFLMFGNGAMSFPFATLFFVSIGLSGTEVGTVNAIGALVTLFAAPYWTSRYPRWKKPARILELFVFLFAISYFALSRQVAFAGIAVVIAFRGVVGASIMPLSDGMALNVTRAAGVGFGKVRVFGSLSWVVLVLISGVLIERLGLPFSQVSAGALSVLSVLVLMQIRPSNYAFIPNDVKPGAEPAPGMLRSVLSQPILLGMMVAVLAIYIGNSGVAQFQPVFLSQLGANKEIIGVAGMLSAVVELPCMIWADILLRKRNPYTLLMISTMIYMAQRVLVYAAPSIGLIMVANASSGVSFSFLTVSIVRLIQQQTAPANTRTMLAFYNVTLISLTSIIGAPLAGALFDHVGALGLYMVAAVGYGIAGLTLLIAGYVARQPHVRDVSAPA